MESMIYGGQTNLDRQTSTDKPKAAARLRSIARRISRLTCHLASSDRALRPGHRVPAEIRPQVTILKAFATL